MDLVAEADPDLSDDPDLADLRDYWERKRAGRALPRRADIDPIELKRHLGDLFLVEPLPDSSDFRYRLIGTHIAGVRGRDPTGKTVTETFAKVSPEMGQAVIDGYRRVLRERVVLRVRGRLALGRRDWVRFDSLHLPLAVNGEEAGMILGKLKTVTGRGETPITRS